MAYSQTFPISFRRKVLRMKSDGESSERISRIMKCSVAVIRVWTKQTKVYANSKLTEEELDEKLKVWEKLTKREEAKSKRRRKEDAIKFGHGEEHKKSALATFTSLGNPDDYTAAIAEHFNQVTEELSSANSTAEQVKAMTTGLLLVQLKGCVDNPPPVTTIADLERVVKLLRLTLDMDRDKKGPQQAINLTILNARTGAAGKIVDVA